MSPEHQTIDTPEHTGHDHELRDIHLEHVHEHACSTTCDHHHAAQHIEFMEPIERHDHSHEYTDEHVHEPGCGHIGYEQAELRIDREKETLHVHDTHEHIHGPNCGHTEYQHVHDEIDKPHVHDEHCGHVDHQKASEHVDEGTHESTAPIEAKTDHSASNGSVVDQSFTEETHRTTETAEEAPQQPIRKVAIVPDVATSEQASISPMISGSSLKVKTTITPPNRKTKQEKSTPLVDQKDTASSIASSQGPVAPSAKLPSIEVPKVDDVARQDIFHAPEISEAPIEETKAEAPIIAADVSIAELTPMPLIVEDELVLDYEVLTDVQHDDDVKRILNPPLHESGTPPLEFTEEVLLGTTTSIEVIDQTFTPSIENSMLDEPSELVTEAGQLQDTDNALDLAAPILQVDRTDFSEVITHAVDSIEWPVLDEIEPDELESRIDVTRTYLEHILEQVNEMNPSEVESSPKELITMLQKLPRESVKELLPLLEEMTELYDMPKLEELLDTFFISNYQTDGIVSQLFVSTAQDSRNTTTSIGQVVLRLLQNSYVHVPRITA